MDTTERFLFYRRVEFPAEVDMTMEQIIRDLYNRLPEDEQRVVTTRKGRVYQSTQLTKAPKSGVIFQIIATQPGAEASIVTRGQERQAVLDTMKPKEESEFWDGDMHILCRGNHLIFCAISLHENSFTNYICSLLQKIGNPKGRDFFHVKPIANVNKARIVADEGVKEVRLRSALYDATHEAIKVKPKLKDTFYHIREAVRSVVSSDKSMSSIIKAEDMMSEIVIRPDGRKKDITAARRAAQLIADDIVNDQDAPEYIIITGENTFIKSTEISVKKLVSFKLHGETIDANEARLEMISYLSELNNRGDTES
jgi:hypothetical protein